jgi:hypothetical protein
MFSKNSETYESCGKTRPYSEQGVEKWQTQQRWYQRKDKKVIYVEQINVYHLDNG